MPKIPFKMRRRLEKKFLPEIDKFSPPPTIRLIDARTQEELAEHADAWNELFKVSENVPPMASYGWISAFFEHKIRSPEEWLCLFAYENDQLLGVFPLIASGSWRIVHYSVLLLKLPYDILHTAGVDCLIRAGREDVMDIFIRYLSSKARVLPFFSYKSLPEYSASSQYFHNRDNKFCILQNYTGSSNTIFMDGGFDEYCSKLSQKFIRNLRRCQRKFESLDDGMLLLDNTFGSSHEKANRFLEVEDRNWKGKNGSSLKHNHHDIQLFLTASERLDRANLARWDFINIGDKSIAALFSLRTRNKLNMLKVGYDEEFSAFSPGNLLFLKVFEHAGCHINFMSDYSWNRIWNPQPVPVYDMIAFSKIPILSRLLETMLKIRRKYNKQTKHCQQQE